MKKTGEKGGASNKKLTPEDILNMSYVDFLALINETNRPPGGKNSIRRLAINSFIDPKSRVLHSGCNTGYCSFEIAHVAKCKVNAIDINRNMITAAKKKLSLEPKPYKNLISFKVGDAHKLRFQDECFDLVFSGGSTVFMKNPSRVVKEYKRVCKPYGFVGDICMHYKKTPPASLLKKINTLLNLNIMPWKKDFWISLYENENLELYFDHTENIPVNPSRSDVESYCKAMIAENLRGNSNEVMKVAAEKFLAYTLLFNENNKYLAYSILIFRKDAQKEQISLFGK